MNKHILSIEFERPQIGKIYTGTRTIGIRLFRSGQSAGASTLNNEEYHMLKKHNPSPTDLEAIQLYSPPYSLVTIYTYIYTGVHIYTHAL